MTAWELHLCAKLVLAELGTIIQGRGGKRGSDFWKVPKGGSQPTTRRSQVWPPTPNKGHEAQLQPLFTKEPCFCQA